MPRHSDRPPTPKTARVVAVAAGVVVIAALYFAREIFVPLALAILLTFLLAPLVRLLEKARVPRGLAAFLVVLAATVGIAALAWGIAAQATDLATELPNYKSDIVKKAHWLREHFGHGAFAQASAALSQVAKDVAATEPAAESAPRGSPQNPIAVQTVSKSTPQQSALAVLGDAVVILEPLGQALIVIVFVIFMLVQRENLRNRVIRLVGHNQLTVTTQALDDVGNRVSNYLIAQSCVNGCYGLIVGLGLWAIGIPNPALWGLLVALLRFVPYIGIWIAAAFPVILSVVLPTQHDVARPLLTLGLFIALEACVANFIEPYLYGTRTGVSSIAILIAAVFWTWLWGGVGLLLSTPLTVVLAVSGKYIPQLEFLYILLGDEPVLTPAERYYQRLLADDSEEAEQLLEEFHQNQPTIDFYSELLLPTLEYLERDTRRGQIDESRRTFILSAIREHIELLREQTASQKEKGQPDEKDDPEVPVNYRVPKDCVVNILCLPAKDEADDLAALMLAHLLEKRGYCARHMGFDSLASEMVDAVEKSRTDLVVVSALPPGAVAHARYVCKRIHARFPAMKMLVGLWSEHLDMDRAKSRIACEDAVELAPDFQVAVEKIHELAQPLLLSAANDAAMQNKPTPLAARESPVAPAAAANQVGHG